MSHNLQWCIPEVLVDVFTQIQTHEWNEFCLVYSVKTMLIFKKEFSMSNKLLEINYVLPLPHL